LAEGADSGSSGSTNDVGDVPGRSRCSLGRGLCDETVRQPLPRPARPRRYVRYVVLDERHRA